MSEVGSAWVSILPSTEGFGTNLERQVGSDLDSSGKRAGSRFGAAMKVGIGAAVVAGVGIGKLLGSSISAASDLNETVAKTGEIFGGAQRSVLKFADAGATSLGQSKQQVLDAAATFGTFGKAAGLSGRDLGKFSTDFVSLSTDLASFNNTSPEEAVEAIGSALRGEAEPMRRFGVLLDDATLRNEALRLGLIKTTSQALTPQQKVLAAQASIYKQTSDAQGDFQRTSGGLANQQRILSAQWEDMKATLGKGLLPVATKVVTGINAGFSSLAPVMARVSAGFSQLGGAVGGSGALAGFAASLRANVLPLLRQWWTLVSTQVYPALQRLGGYLVTTFGPVFARIGQIISTQVVPIVAKLVSLWLTKLYPALIKIASQIAQRLAPVFTTVARTLQTQVLPAVSRLLAKYREWMPTIQRVVMVVIKVTGAVLTFAAAILGRVIPPITKLQGFLIGRLIGAVIKTVGAIIKSIAVMLDFGAAMVRGGEKVAEFAGKVRDKIGDAIDVIQGLPDKAKSALGNLGSTLYDAGAALVQGLIDGIQSKISAVTSKVSELAGKMGRFFPGSPVREGPLRSWNNGGAGKRLVGMLADGLGDTAPVDRAMAGLSGRVAVAPRVAASQLRDELDGRRGGGRESDADVIYRAIRDAMDPAIQLMGTKGRMA